MFGISRFENSSCGTGCLRDFHALKPRTAASIPIPMTTTDKRIFNETLPIDCNRDFGFCNLARGNRRLYFQCSRRDRSWKLVSCPENKLTKFGVFRGLKPNSILRPYAGAESPGLLKTTTASVRDNTLVRGCGGFGWWLVGVIALAGVDLVAFFAGGDFDFAELAVPIFVFGIVA